MGINLSIGLQTSDTFAVHFRPSFVGWLLIGLIAGWLVGKIARGRGC